MTSVIFIFEILGTIAFSVSGALTAAKKGLDVFGVVILGVTTAVGGGILRDIIIGVVPPTVFINPSYAAIAAGAALFVCIPRVMRSMTERVLYNKLMLIFDSVGLGVFTSVGVLAAYVLFPDKMFLAVFVGVVTGVGGGVMRDVLAGNIPYIFVKHIYACASIIGAVLCAVLLGLMPKTAAMLISAAVIVIVRLISAYFKINLPIPSKK